MLKTTPFHERTAALCASHAWRRWAGHIVASSYELSHEREYHAIRSSAALFDVSPLYKYRVTGRDAAVLLDHVVTRSVRGMLVGQVGYTPWCDAAGKVLDDGTVARLKETEFRVTAAEPNLRWLQDNAGGLEVRVEDVSESIASLALQGPASRLILDNVELKYFRIVDTAYRGIPVQISRTGYTGDLGFEIWVEKSRALELWDALIQAGMPYGIVPAGMLALDVARIEAGLMLIDVDYVPARKALIESQTSSPFELDLAWTVNLKKDRFVGRAALAAEAERGACSSSASRSNGNRSSGSTPRSGSPRACPPPPGARASPSTPATSRRVTRRAAAGRRSSRNTSRSRTCARSGPRPARSSRSRSRSSTGASAPRRAL